MTAKRTASRIRAFPYRVEFLQNSANTDIEKGEWNGVFYAYCAVVPLCQAGIKELEGINFGHVLTEELYLFRTQQNAEIKRFLRIHFQEEIYEIKRLVKDYDFSGLLNIIALRIDV